MTFGRPNAEGELEPNSRIVCDITLLKTLARVIPKIPGTLFGKVTGIAIDRGRVAEHCTAGALFERFREIIPLSDRERPGTHRELGRGILLYDVSAAPAALWKLIYDGFLGILPSISGINYHIRGAQIAFVSGLSGSCLYRGEWYKLIQILAESARILRLILATTNLPGVELKSIFCPREISASGRKSKASIARTLLIDLERTRLRKTEEGAFCIDYTASGELTLSPTLTIRLI